MWNQEKKDPPEAVWRVVVSRVTLLAVGLSLVYVGHFFFGPGTVTLFVLGVVVSTLALMPVRLIQRLFEQLNTPPSTGVNDDPTDSWLYWLFRIWK